MMSFRRFTLSFALPAGSLSAGSYTVSVKVSAELNDTNGQAITTVPVTVVV